MIPILYKEDETNFVHNGIGALYESLSCNVHEIENGAFTLELEYPVNGELFTEIEDFRIIQAKPNDADDPHNFRIYEIEKSIDDLTIFVRANTITNDLGTNLITEASAAEADAQEAMDAIKLSLIEYTPFDFVSNIETKSSSSWARINPLNAIVGTRGSLVDLWGGEIKRTNDTIYLYSRRGTDRVATLRTGKNIEGLTTLVSTAAIVTKIVPTFSYQPVDIPEYIMMERYDGVIEKQRLTGSSNKAVEEEITVVGDVVTSQYADNYPMYRWSSVDYGDDSDLRDNIESYIDSQLTMIEDSPDIIDTSNFHSDLENYVKSQLDSKASQYFTHRAPYIDKPTVRIKADIMQLTDSPEWEMFKKLEEIELTDTVDVWVEEYGIDVEVRVTELVYDSMAEQVVRFTAGNDRASRQSSSDRAYNNLDTRVSDYFNSLTTGVNRLATRTAEGTNRRFAGVTEPSGPLMGRGDMWFKEVEQGKVEIWVHDGRYWQPVMNEDFSDIMQAKIDQMMSDIIEAKNLANDAFIKAEDMVNDILDNLKDYVDMEIAALEFDPETIWNRIDEVSRMTMEALDNSRVQGAILGNDGRTLYNRNRLLGPTSRLMEFDMDKIVFEHNGEGYTPGMVYTLSFKTTDLEFPDTQVFSEVTVNTILDTITEYIILGGDF